MESGGATNSISGVALTERKHKESVFGSHNCGGSSMTDVV